MPLGNIKESQIGFVLAGLYSYSRMGGGGDLGNFSLVWGSKIQLNCSSRVPAAHSHPKIPKTPPLGRTTQSIDTNKVKIKPDRKGRG